MPDGPGKSPGIPCSPKKFWNECRWSIEPFMPSSRSPTSDATEWSLLFESSPVLCACSDAKSGCFFYKLNNEMRSCELRMVFFFFCFQSFRRTLFLSVIRQQTTNFSVFKIINHQNQKNMQIGTKNSTDSLIPDSSACPNSESRSSVLRSRSCVDESRDDRLWSFMRTRSRLRSPLRKWWAAAAANNGCTSFNVVEFSRSGLRPCWARYKSTLLMRFCGGGVKWLVRSSGKSHGNDVDVCLCVYNTCNGSISIKSKNPKETSTCKFRKRVNFFFFFKFQEKTILL